MSILQYINNFLLAGKQAPMVGTQFLNWHQVKQCILIAYEYQLSEITDFITHCHNDHIDIDVYIIYNGKPELAPKPVFKHQVLSKKDFSIFQIPKNELLVKLHKTDLLINLGNKEQLKANALSKLISATCKISTYEDAIFDISITATNNTTNYLKEVYTYLNMINTK